MSWFRREPPPPPKKSIPGWVSVATPIIFAVIIGLLSIVYSGLYDNVKAMDAKKADKETIQQMLENQKLQIKHNQEALDQQQRNIEKQNEAIQKTLDEVRQIKQAPAPPSGFQIRDREPVKPALSPAEFQQYLKMNKEERRAFRSLHPSYATLPE